MIEPQELLLQPTDGMDTTAVHSAAGPGIHVVLGRNNSGKTRLLEVLVTGAGLAATVDLRSIDRVRRFDHAMLNAEWASLGRVRFTWSRGTPPPVPLDRQFPVGEVPADLKVDDSSTSELRARKAGLEGEFWDFVRGEAWPLLRTRQAIVVPTNRYLEQEASLMGSASLSAPALWSSLLGNMERSDVAAERERFVAINDGLSTITEGLRLRSLGTGGRSIMHISEPGAPDRPLDQCGDGLRDLVGILLFAFMYPDYDLMLDDPGIRLHQHAQRRLLAFLNEQAKRRAVWIASHEGVFIGAPQVQRRFYVLRETGKDKSYVRELANAAALKEAHRELGWLPGDAFLSDHVLMCEGPSDKVAFEAAVEWLAERDITRAATVVTDLGGDGVVWGNPAELKRRIELVRGIAPYATHCVLVDRGNKTDRQVETLKRNVEGAGATLELLSRNELEDFWLDPALVEVILVGLAKSASVVRGEVVEAPALAEVRELLRLHGGEGKKGSAVLEAISGTVGLIYSKTRGARLAIENLKSVAPDQAEALMAEVERALPRRE